MKRWLLIEVDVPEELSLNFMNTAIENIAKKEGWKVGFIGNYPRIEDVKESYPLIKQDQERKDDSAIL